MGLDFRADSVRALLINAANVKKEYAKVSGYKRWNKGKYIDASKNMFRHHPLDYLELMQEAVEILSNVVDRKRL